MKDGVWRSGVGGWPVAIEACCAVGVVSVVCHCTKLAGCAVGVVGVVCHCTKLAGCAVGVGIVV